LHPLVFTFILLATVTFVLNACASSTLKTTSNPTINKMLSEIKTDTDPAFIYPYKQTKFVPPEGKTLLIMGQTEERINEYMQHFSNQKKPSGWMAYWGITSLDGIKSSKPNETGSSQNHQMLVDRFPNTVLQSALWMVGKWDIVNKTDKGEYDAVIKEFAVWAKNIKRPIYLRIGYEFDGKHNALEPKDYVKAYRRIVDLIRAQGTNNIAFVWHSYAAPTYKNHPLSAWYPGDDYVDWVGISLFGQSYASRPSKEVNAVFNFAKQHKKPTMIAEASPIRGIQKENNAAWNSWFVNMLSLSYEKNVKAISFINEDWRQLKIEGISDWKDARLNNNKNIYSAWFKEINKDRYLTQSPDLFKQLDYTP